MTLTNRLTVFFLTALAGVLGGFSVGLYLLAQHHLARQLDERASAALDSLVAAVEWEPEGMEWEPAQRKIGGTEPFVWGLFQGDGHWVDGSPNSAAWLRPYAIPAPEGEQLREDTLWEGAPWRVTCRTLRAAPRTKSSRPEAEARCYHTLVLLAAFPLRPMQGTLQTIAILLIGLSLGTWISAALLGRWLCRRALRPVVQMAEAAQRITAEGLAQRLPSPGTGDELAAFGDAFNDLLARLQEAFERQRRFTGEASHQLRTPLTAILGQIEVALRRDRQAAEYRHALGVVQREAIQMHQSVEMLLFLARADVEAELPDLEVINLADWLPGYLASWDQHPRRADLRWVGTTKGRCRTHPALLAQALDNLIDNACKYSPPGSPIVMTTTQGDGELTLTVQDRGDGITERERELIFEPFFRSERARLRGVAGVGLGLAVTARIVTALGGRIEVESKLGCGSRFSLLFPDENLG